MTSWPVRLRLASPDGLLVGVAIPPDAATVPGDVLAALAPEERRFADALAAPRRATWVGGRLALRTALAEVTSLAVDRIPGILPNGRGAPSLPDGHLGSISHKPGFAVALVAVGLDDAHVGVDVERAEPRAIDVSGRVLTAAERATLAGLSPSERSVEVLARFSAKEALYKALDPFLQRYVAFEEAEVERRPNGVLAFTLRLRDPPDTSFEARGSQALHDGWWVSTVTALRRKASRK
jgi:phosphopantetheine--protein transferase-like protein